MSTYQYYEFKAVDRPLTSAQQAALRKRQSTLQAQLDTIDAELADAETYLQLADTIDAFLGRLADGLDGLDIAGQQRILRLVVREVLIGSDDNKVTIRHSIPTPNAGSDRSYPLRGSSHLASVGQSVSDVCV